MPENPIIFPTVKNLHTSHFDRIAQDVLGEFFMLFSRCKIKNDLIKKNFPPRAKINMHFYYSHNYCCGKNPTIYLQNAEQLDI